MSFNFSWNINSNSLLSLTCVYAKLHLRDITQGQPLLACELWGFVYVCLDEKPTQCPYLFCRPGSWCCCGLVWPSDDRHQVRPETGSQVLQHRLEGQRFPVFQATSTSLHIIPPARQLSSPFSCWQSTTSVPDCTVQSAPVHTMCIGWCSFAVLSLPAPCHMSIWELALYGYDGFI